MKTAIDVVKGRIVDVNARGEVTIVCRYDDWFTLTKRGYRECLVQMVDSRPVSEKQRRSCYALITSIATFTGENAERTKEYMKLKFLADDFGETADRIFSLSNAPMSLVCAFQRYLVRFILEWDIPCSFSLLDFCDDTADYIYSCLINKKCCICGKRTQLHHVDRVGTGRNRDDIIHEGMEAMPLCAEHHGECHTLGQTTFNEKYHLPGGIVLDKTLCRIYKLKGEKKNGA